MRKRLPEPVVGSAAGRLRVEHGDLSTIKGDKVAVVSSWDSQPEMSRSLSVYLRELTDNGYRVLLVSTAEFPQPLLWPFGLPENVVVTRRQNIGYDFGSWAAGIAACPQVLEAKSVLLTNDSLVGPFAPLKELLALAEQNPNDVAFLTDSLSPVPHGQSFFVRFTGAALANPVVSTFYRNVRPQRSKELVIEKYEIPLAQVCAKAGLSCGVIFSGRRIGAGLDNPTLSAWRKLLFGGAPLLKRSVLLEPLFRPDSIQMQQVVARNFAEKIEEWLPASSVVRLPGLETVSTNKESWLDSPSVVLLTAECDADGNEVWSAEEVKFLRFAPTSNPAEIIRSLARSGSGGNEAVLLDVATWTRLDAATVEEAKERESQSGLEFPKLLVEEPRQVSRRLAVPDVPGWADGVMQVAPTSFLWPAPPLDLENPKLQLDAERVHYPRMRAAALAQVLKQRSIPGVLLPGRMGPSFQGLELDGYSESEFERWLSEAKSAARRISPDKPRVALFDYTTTQASDS